MQDSETKTEWSHILGEGKKGPLKGKFLEQIPSAMTDWASWKAEYPDTTVALMSRTTEDYKLNFYHSPSHFALGLVHEGKECAWRFNTLLEKEITHDTIGKTDIVILASRKHFTARAYQRELNGQSLTFELKYGAITDKETGSTWHPISGKAITGKLKGKSLKALPAIMSFGKVWKQFHPGTKVVPEKGEKP